MIRLRLTVGGDDDGTKAALAHVMAENERLRMALHAITVLDTFSDGQEKKLIAEQALDGD